MKRILFILLIIIGITNVKALEETYYGEYSGYSEFSTDIVNKSDTVDVLTERRNRYYNDIKTYGEYYLENENDSSFPLIDKNDYYKTAISEWSNTKPSNKLNRVIGYKTIYQYSDLEDIRYIHFSKLSGSYGAFRISEIQIYVNDALIDYNYYCDSCSTNFGSYIKNGNYKENMSIVYNGGYLRLDLKSYYRADNIKIKLYLFDMGYDPKIYEVGMSKDIELSKVFGNVLYNSYFTYREVDEIEVREITYNNMTNSKPIYKPAITTEEYVASTKTRLVNTYKTYNYYDTLYRYYRVDRIISDYMNDKTDIYPNIIEDDYIDYYKYRTRSKLVVDLPIVITDTKKLSDYIKESTNILTVDGLVNESVNSDYKVDLIIDDIKVPITISVNKESNIIKEPVKKVEDVIKETPKVEPSKEVVVINDKKEEVPKEEIVTENNSNVVTEEEKEIVVVEGKTNTNKEAKKASFNYIFLLITLIPFLFIVIKKILKLKNKVWYN